ncbi:MAG: type II toxin-antitoxin system Phd/YefM family antitoxin [Deltaproteobacteria bacterium]|nr:type II toxin-antitoxin system Phd/YefM family antitoxin [Deltaproteobacteria bacterium]
MKPLRVSEDIVPMAEFKGQAARWFRRVAETNQPVVITQNGKPAGVLLSPTEYDRIVERERFLRDVAAGLGDPGDAWTITTDELRRRLGLGDDPGK